MGRRASEVEISDSLILALVRARRPNNSEKKKKPLSSPKKGKRGDLLYPPELPSFFLGEETNPSEWYKKKKVLGLGLHAQPSASDQWVFMQP